VDVQKAERKEKCLGGGSPQLSHFFYRVVYRYQIVHQCVRFHTKLLKNLGVKAAANGTEFSEDNTDNKNSHSAGFKSGTRCWEEKSGAVKLLRAVL
jgi:hypothetical protein